MGRSIDCCAATRWWIVTGGDSQDNPASDLTFIAEWRWILYLWNRSAGVKKEIVEAFRSEEGSAVVEFVILALPLFLPMVIFLGAVHQSATVSADIRSLARQSARAFITSPSEDFENARMQTVLQLFESKVLRPAGIREVPVISIMCSATPCLTPDSRVQAKVTLFQSANQLSGIFRFLSAPNQTFVATDTQIVDAWR